MGSQNSVMNQRHVSSKPSRGEPEFCRVEPGLGLGLGPDQFSNFESRLGLGFALSSNSECRLGLGLGKCSNPESRLGLGLDNFLNSESMIWRGLDTFRSRNVLFCKMIINAEWLVSFHKKENRGMFILKFPLVR